MVSFPRLPFRLWLFAVVLPVVVLPVVVLSAATPIAAGAAETGGADPISADVLPHISAYVECGRRHFLKLGRTEATPFEAAEITVAAECGAHIDRTREVLADHGHTRRSVQNAYISGLYDTIAPAFREAFALGQASRMADAQTRKLAEIWQACVFEFAGEAALVGTEGATTIVRGAMAYCRPDEDAYRTRLTAPGGDVAAIVEAKVFPLIVKETEDLAIALILKIRSGAPEERRKSPEDQPA